MISDEAIEKRAIQRHYDLTTVFYRLLWGEHIHHGLWSGDESPEVAQRQLTEELAALAGVSRGNLKVLDVGCGMGGSSMLLARRFDCQVTGVTLSPVQKWWATGTALVRGMRTRTRFLHADAERVEFPAGTFDVVWSVECTEHLFAKPEFFARASQWLKPGGRMAICAWLTADDLADDRSRQLIRDICRGMLCPSLGSRSDYVDWMTAAGLRMRECEDWTPRVARTWQICRDRVRRWNMRGLARRIDPGSVDFLDKFQSMIDAYASGALRYGCFIAEKPAT